jgi:hypothetical protein
VTIAEVQELVVVLIKLVHPQEANKVFKNIDRVILQVKIINKTINLKTKMEK